MVRIGKLLYTVLRWAVLFLLAIIFLERPRFNLECWILFLLTIQNLYFENLLCPNNLLFDTGRISRFNFAQNLGLRT